jgi:hypothetical protein
MGDVVKSLYDKVSFLDIHEAGADDQASGV